MNKDDMLLQDLAEKLAHGEKASIRWNAARDLGKSGDPRALAFLLSALDDPHHNVQVQAARALGRLGIEECLPSLAEKLHTSNPYVKQNVLRALSMFKTADVLPYFMHVVIDDRTLQVRMTALALLQKLKDECAFPTLLVALRNGVTPWDIGYAAEILGSFGSKAEAVLIQALREGTLVAKDHPYHEEHARQVRYFAIWQLSEIGTDQSVPLISPYLNDKTGYLGIGPLGEVVLRGLQHIGTPDALNAIETWKNKQSQTA